MSNILVTGGSGFIGSNLVDKLIELGHKVFVIDDLSTGLKINNNDNAHYLLIDITQYIESNDSLKELIRNQSISIVYHLAALSDVRKGINDPVTTYNINLLSLVSIFEACRNCEIEKFIFTSTSAVYGEPEYLPVDEVHRTVPISPYGLSKLAAEQYLQYQNKNSNMDVIVFRLPNVYGQRQRPDLEGGVVSIFNYKIKNNGQVTFYGDGKQTRDWVHVYDIVEALIKLKLMNNINFEIISLGSEKTNSLMDLFNLLVETNNYKISPIFDEPKKGDIKHMIMSGKKARNLLKWKQKIYIEEGIKLMGK
tara:strand:+ start:100 stop:1023 length:924 start_codon:yes stop_codon:yes gene_type:complete